ncbi:unnamed protein product [Urochloa humidicola]
MASRRLFSYDPYDYYYSPYHYSSPYHQYYKHPAVSRAAGGFFPAAAPEPVTVAPRPRATESLSRTPVSIPVHFVGSERETERVTTARMPPPPLAASAMVPRKRAPSAEEAAVRVQAAARGFLARRSVREVEREAADVGAQIAREAAALRRDARARVAVGEALMRMLLRLDAVRGAREYRRTVTKRVLKLQDAVDALEATPSTEPEVTAEVAAGEGAAASELPDVAERGGGVEAEEAAAEMEVDGDGADGEPEQAAHDAGIIVDSGKQEGSGTEGEWEMVTEEAEPVAEPPATTCPEAPRPQQPARAEINRTAVEGGGEGGLDARKVMEMVAALCERSAQQCAVIGALAERVDALERAVRRVEDAERRRRRAKKLRKEGKGNNHQSKFYSD